MIRVKATPTRRRGGFSLLEVIVVVAILAILLALGATLVSPPRARLYSNNVASLMRQARVEAVKLNRPVAVVWDPTAKEFTSRYTQTGATINNTCTSNTVLVTESAADYENLTITFSPSSIQNGILWLPSTLLRTCAGTAVSPVMVTIADARNSFTITISTSGEVTIQ